jgi:hypothetical protein
MLFPKTKVLLVSKLLKRFLLRNVTKKHNFCFMRGRNKTNLMHN